MCVDPMCEKDGIKFCADCLSTGPQLSLNPHSFSHKYRVADCLQIPLYHRDWTISDELKLLAGIEKHGVGNWKVIAEFMSSGKTIKQIEEHYNEHYMGIHGYCLPSKVIVNDKLVDTEETFFAGSISKQGEIEKEEDYNNLNSCRMSVVKGYSRGEVIKRDIGKELMSRGSSQNNKGEKPALVGSDLPGFMPLRGDFDVEFENDAENILADMEFSVL